ncbi:hypothetical protein A2526_03825 [candidate division WOR-1 bacterium RIFOXYD2_FULL_36_8]|uniref:Uncharacterized protein n=1 Tax=candidate division WOR-1 bacterium RIFOXYB2_FULL_36_35 TaxID=1802578 RepID=A0A1F4S6S6_UNCSA|nr:MAG: hypothetical protein A2230_04070 [candidate division WOR-1 bacterium RIFOXYA2_FULL_36_21]OGC16138.1 MAG: hypothetical protein A2290_07100 [candidate division WOR-1 bacterium RIFOXYB2_FULL_36_35]OGC16939.1 MAG: hypothetical protein A2282_00690 [candidate division WOR-1 bacterium RIFOXYA12_FULL_36_13]OGC38711.1 MAG: hypothetical protein A2526_03825 [candidate division WOR-1 bacterium RIFOXYD2_FULL_36_8]
MTVTTSVKGKVRNIAAWAQTGLSTLSGKTKAALAEIPGDIRRADPKFAIRLGEALQPEADSIGKGLTLSSGVLNAAAKLTSLEVSVSLPPAMIKVRTVEKTGAISSGDVSFTIKYSTLTQGRLRIVKGLYALADNIDKISEHINWIPNTLRFGTKCFHYRFDFGSEFYSTGWKATQKEMREKDFIKLLGKKGITDNMIRKWIADLLIENDEKIIRVRFLENMEGARANKIGNRDVYDLIIPLKDFLEHFSLTNDAEINANGEFSLKREFNLKR